MKFFNVQTSILLTMSMMLLSCGKTNFVPTPNSVLATKVLFENNYKVAESEVQYIQPNLSENNTTLAFQVKGANGDFVNSLLLSQLVITENGTPVPGVTLNKNSVTHTATADIVFAIDVTGSMAPTIEAAKRKLIDFVNNTRAQGYHTRMCVMTFGDYTVKYCNRFYNNDPNDSSTETQVSELISDITNLRAMTGGMDPGGTDFDENPMRAVIDAAAAPWGSDSQRFVILVTDAGFLYSPGNSGSIGAGAPIYTNVLNAISQAKMKIFAVTPSKAGYNSNFGAQKSIVEHSEGEWYRYADLVSGAITLNTVLDKILSSIDTTFFIDYTLTAQSVLDPALPLSQRDIQLSLVDPLLGEIKGLAITSNLPNGRGADPKRFVISDKEVNPSSIKVFIDGFQLPSGFSLINQKEIEFLVAQIPYSEIVIKYLNASVKDSIRLTPIQISADVTKFDRILFSINGIEVDKKYFELVALDMNLTSVVLNDDIFAIDDPFKINQTGEMDILIKIK